MAQDFERAVAKDSTSDINIGTTARAVIDSNSDDAIVGIRMANVPQDVPVVNDITAPVKNSTGTIK